MARREKAAAVVRTAPENAPADWQDRDDERWREFAVGDANDDPDYDAKMRSLFGHPTDLQRYYAERYMDQARLITPRYDAAGATARGALSERVRSRLLGGDVSGEPRDYHGRWTASGGGGGEERGGAHGARARATGKAEGKAEGKATGKAEGKPAGKAAAKPRARRGAKGGEAKQQEDDERAKGIAEVKAAKRAIGVAQKQREAAAKTLRDAKAKSDTAHKAFNDALAHREAVHAQVKAEIRQAALEHAAAHAPVKFGKWQRADAAMAARIAKMPEGRAKQEAEILRKIKQDDVAYNYELKHSYFEDPRSIAAHERVNATGKARVEAANAHEAAAKAHEATEEPLYHAEEAYMVARRAHGVDEKGAPIAEKTAPIHLDTKAIARATDTRQIEAALRAIGPNIKVGLHGANLERARDIAFEIADLAEEYPHAMAHLKYIGAASDPAMARELRGHRGGLLGGNPDDMYASYNPSKQGIMFEKRVTHVSGEGTKAWLRNLRTGWLAADKHDVNVSRHVARYITRHEFGHHVDLTLQKYAGVAGKHAQNHYLNRMRESHFDGKGISQYGGMLHVERFAEAFAALRYGRDAAKAHPYTQALGRMLHAYMP